MIETKLRNSLLPVFGFNSVDDIPEDASLVTDLGADSLDFVEIVYLIERDFGVTLKTNELVFSGVSVPAETLFVEGCLTDEGAALLRKELPGDSGRIRAGMTRMELFQSLTVRDLANVIRQRMNKGE